MKRFLFILVVSFFASAVSAQHPTWRTKTFLVEQDSMRVDTLSLVPGTAALSNHGSPLDSSLFVLYPLLSTLVVDTSLVHDSLTIHYQVFPLNFNARYFRKDSTLIFADFAEFKPYTVGDYLPRVNEQSNIRKTGSITRGIALGNAQDLSVNSSFQLELSGNITDDIQVLASVSDDNIPIQPQGNTAQLQDFDNVFIQLYNEKSKLVAGDFRLNGGPNYFLQYRKKLKGVNFSTSLLAGEESQMHFEASAAVSKGKFSRNIIQGIEGVQGPYRLTGNEGETFIVILSGSEKVYIDGREMKRGQEYDYVIDYNASTIQFTPNRRITKDRRIIVEFQYSDKNYARSLVHSRVNYQGKKSSFFLSVYGEQDSKNQPLQLDLSDEDRRIMQLAGDQLQAAAVSGVDSLGYSADYVLYALTDSLGYDSILVYSTHPDSAFYRASFSFVGSGKGDYVESDFTANGRVFKWIAPDTLNNELVRYGDYAPIRILTTPKKRQMISGGGKWEMGSYVMEVEGAASVYDVNTFSSLNQDDDVGMAARFSLQKSPTPSDSSWRFIPRLAGEFTSRHFQRIERFRAVEFERNWNLLQLDPNLGLLYGSAGFKLEKTHLASLDVLGEVLEFGDTLSGVRLNLLSSGSQKGWTWDVKASALQSEGADNSSFYRSRSHFKKSWSRITLGYLDDFEENKKWNALSDSLIVGSYGYYDGKVYLSNGDSTRSNFELYARQRVDRAFSSGNLGYSAKSEEFGARSLWKISGDHSLSVNVSNRKLIILNEDIINQDPENTLLMRVEHKLRWMRGLFSSNTFYEMGSGLEQKKEFVYIQVLPGQGTYVWNDYNGDGVRDLVEFEIAQFSYEADYIRTFLPTDEFVKTFSNSFNQTISINPAVVWAKKGGFKKIISHFSNTGAVRISRKTTKEADGDRFNPFLLEVADSSLLALNSNFRNTLFFNRTNPKFGANYTFQDNRSKSLLTNGFESRMTAFHEVSIRWNLKSSITVNLTGKSGEKKNGSDFLSGRNYALKQTELSGALTWQPQPTYQISVVGNVGNKSNALEFGGETAQHVDLGVVSKISDIKKGSLQGELHVVQIKYDGNANSTLAFEMLNGLNKGGNITWSLNMQRKISKNLQINILYNGRKSEGNGAIHSGGAQIRAFF